MQTLYKKDTKGKIRIWNVWIDGDKIIQESGLNEGKLVTHEKTCKPKNIGKSNATDGNTQAKSEYKALIKQKLDEGYFRTIKEANTEEVILPMLAKTYADEEDKIDWSTAYIQPKLDGMRCLAHIKNGNVTLVSRDGKIINNMEHIINELVDLNDQILDGELYSHGLSFQENMKLIKKYREGETEKVKYHVYDRVSAECFTDRSFANFGLIKANKFEFIEYVSTLPINNKADLQRFHSLNIGDGYEGSIVRWGDVGYKVNGRSSNLLKYKDFLDLDATIIDIEPAEQRPDWGVPVLKYKDKTFRAGMKYSHKEREEFLLNKKNYIGKVANIRFFEWTDDEIPRFPVMVGIHEDR